MKLERKMPGHKSPFKVKDFNVIVGVMGSLQTNQRGLNLSDYF